MIALRIPAGILTAAFVFATGNALAETKTEWVDYSQGDLKLKGYLAYDDKITGKRPAIFVIHDREGMTENTKRKVEMWSKLGYVAFAADIFGVLPKNLDEVLAQTSMFRKDRPLLKARTQAAFDVLVKNPMVETAKIAQVGYCFGGSTGVEFASTGAPIALNVAIHGSFGGHEPGWAKNVKGMYLVLHGAE